MRPEPSTAAALVVAFWVVADAWLIYGAMQHVFWRFA